ncbi:MAG: hypothetical protein ACLUNZ_13070 [Evtepia sp.]
MLRILTGRAGSGKTTEIFRRMAAEGQQRKQILLVPEQASFETEQRFCRENGNRAGGVWRGPLLYPFGKPCPHSWPGAWPSLCWTRADGC